MKHLSETIIILLFIQICSYGQVEIYKEVDYLGTKLNLVSEGWQLKSDYRDKKIYSFIPTCHSPNNKGIAFALNRHSKYSLDSFNSALKENNADKNSINYNKGLAHLMAGEYLAAINIFESLLNTSIAQEKNLFLNLGYAHFQKSLRLKKYDTTFDLALKYSFLAKKILKNPVIDYNLAIISAHINKIYFPESYLKLEDLNNKYWKSFRDVMQMKYTDSKFDIKSSNELPIYHNIRHDRHLPSQVNYGYGLIHKLDLQEAIKHLNNICKNRTGYAHSYFALALAYYEKGDIDQAKTTFHKLLKIKEGASWEAYYGLAVVSLAEEKLDWAIEYSNKAIRLNTDAIPCYLVLAKALYKKTLVIDNKLSYSQRMIKDRYLIDSAYISLKKYLDNTVEKSNKQEAEMIFAYINLHPTIDNLYVAEAYFEGLTKYINYKSEGFLGKGVCLYRVGKYKEAYLCFQKVLESGAETQKSVVYQHLGELFFDTSLYDEAINSYKKALKITNDSLSVCAGLGNSYLRVGKYKESENMYQIARKMKISDVLLKNNEAVAIFFNAKDKLKANSDTVEFRQSMADCHNLLHSVIQTNVEKEDSLYTWVAWLNMASFYSQDKKDTTLAIKEVKKIDSVSRQKSDWYLPVIRARLWNNLGVGYFINQSKRIEAYSAFNKGQSELIDWLVPEHNKALLDGGESNITFLEGKYSQTFKEFVSVYTFLQVPIKEKPIFMQLHLEPQYDLNYPCLPQLDFITLPCKD